MITPQVRYFGSYSEKMVITVHNTACIFTGERFLPSTGKYFSWTLSSVRHVMGGEVAIQECGIDFPAIIRMFTDLSTNEAMFTSRAIMFHVEHKK
jgi:hypothetical protein